MTTIRWVLIFMFVAGLAWAKEAQGKTEIAFDAKTEVSARKQLTLGDVAKVQGGSEALLRDLASRPLENGDIVTLRQALREFKMESAEVQGAQIHMPGDFEIKKVNGYSSEEFRRKLMNKVSAACNDCTFEVQSVRDQNVQLAADWKMTGADVKPVGSQLITLESESTGRTGWIPVNMKVRRPAMVVKRTIPLGQRLTMDDVEARETDVSFAKDLPLAAADVDGRLATRHLSAGTALFPNDVKQEEAVKRGQQVKLLTGTDEFEVTLNAVAEENGRIGDTVKVKNPDGGKLLSAVVTGSAQVRLR